jgi:hypothetical protein
MKVSGFDSPSARLHQFRRTDQFDVRLDQNVGTADRLFLKYSYDNTDLTTPGLVPVRSGANVPTRPYLAADGALTTTATPLVNQSDTLNYVKVLSPNVVKETRAGVVRWDQSINPLGNTFNTAEALGVPGINFNDKSGGLLSRKWHDHLDPGGKHRHRN